MGFFDFLRNKKRDKEREEKSLTQQETEQRAAAPKGVEESSKQQEKGGTKEALLAEFDFDSTCHQRYENNQPVYGLQVCPRYIKIRKNINGCPGYQLRPGDGYIVTATNGDSGLPQFSPKPMRIAKITDNEILLKGYPVYAQSPFGWQEFDLSDYGFSIILSNGVAHKCILHMYDRNVDLEYRKSDSGQIEKNFSGNFYVTKYREDEYSEMVRNATYNPFKITVNPSANSNLEFLNLVPVFKRDIILLSQSGMPAIQIVSGYIFNGIESYYNKAGYVPKAIVDAIIEQVYTAAKQTAFANCVGSIEQVKYNMYWSLTHK